MHMVTCVHYILRWLMLGSNHTSDNGMQCPTCFCPDAAINDFGQSLAGTEHTWKGFKSCVCVTWVQAL